MIKIGKEKVLLLHQLMAEATGLELNGILNEISKSRLVE